MATNGHPLVGAICQCRWLIRNGLQPVVALQQWLATVDVAANGHLVAVASIWRLNRSLRQYRRLMLTIAVYPATCDLPKTCDQLSPVSNANAGPSMDTRHCS
ncbi:hypothetical protein Ancab_019440 [Ancistrocladus abbreviatus]